MGSDMSVHFSSELTAWETPPEVFGPLDDEFKFGLDAAASPKNAKCARYLTTGALAKDWAALSKGRAVWLNPPYGRGLSDWVAKARQEGERVVVVALLPARTDTAFFHTHVARGEVRLLRGRVKFLVDGAVTGVAPFPSLIAVWGPHVVPSIRCWEVSKP